MTRKTPPRTTTTRRPRRRPGRAAAARKPPKALAPESLESGALGPEPASAVEQAAAGAASSLAATLAAEAPGLPSDIAFAVPEPEYAARVPPPEPERPVPAGRRAVFFDVENTSHAPHIERVLQHLALDRQESRTEFVAVGNWRVIGHDVGRLLARRGAQLVHSAPATGVRDWSDLRIAVSAGVWLAAARPGDRIEIVSEDRAFDAVGDVAAALGIEFHRLSYRGLSETLPADKPAEKAPASRARGRGRRGRGPGRVEAAPTRLATAPRAHAERRHHAPGHAPAHAPASGRPPEEPHTAPHDEIIHVIRDLIHRAHGRPVLIDTLARELKDRGFARTPGSPRLVTRLRRLRELSVSPTGMIALAEGARAGASAAEAHPRPAPAVPATERVDTAPDEAQMTLVEQAPSSGDTPEPPRPRRRRRGGRQRRRGSSARTTA
ncbi:MAG: hypothetical protein A2X52_03855 [Candidatus Rokubacteria bacterium GWC2_70_16]|nr:MAG: hypothetical protein A2X52_03855 [Candidatus Rokubacteria bacterium GWC2_70_16]